MFPLERIMARPKILLLAAAGVSALATAFPCQVQAIDVVVDGTTYDVTIFSGSFNNNQSKFNTPPLGLMPWFGKEGLAAQFALALGTSLGPIGINRITYPTGSINYGNLFATQIVSLPSGSANVFGQALASNLVAASYFTNGVIPRYWAQAVAKLPARAASAVPGPLPLIGMAFAYGYSRKVRSRIRRRLSA